MRIGIGIDTGGTCTDAVAYDFETDRLLAKGKALTTRENLSDGIGRALDMLPPELIRQGVAHLAVNDAGHERLRREQGRPGEAPDLRAYGRADPAVQRRGRIRL